MEKAYQTRGGMYGNIDRERYLMNLQDLLQHHQDYTTNVPNRYEQTIERLNKAMPARDTAEVAAAISDWLKSINMQYYRFRPAKLKMLRETLEPVIEQERETLLEYRKRSITTLMVEDRPVISRLFEVFKDKLGPIGAGKALHVLAPKMFPLWDNAIASAAGVSTSQGYFQFMLIRKEQVAALPKGLPENLYPLKLLDECDYLRFTRNNDTMDSGKNLKRR